jgi:hypothetical protein
MKSMINAFLCVSILAFTVGCGKDNSSGGGGSTATSNLGSGTNSAALTAATKQAVANLNTWYNGAVEGSFQQGVYQVTKIRYSSSSAANNSNCTTKTFLGIPFQYCTGSSSTGSAGTPISNSTVSLIVNTLAIKNKGNTELNTIMNNGTSIGTLISASQTGNVFRLDFLTSSNTLVSYFIDKTYHSLLNPVRKIEQSQSGITQTDVQAQRLY